MADACRYMPSNLNLYCLKPNACPQRVSSAPLKPVWKNKQNISLYMFMIWLSGWRVKRVYHEGKSRNEGPRVGKCGSCKLKFGQGGQQPWQKPGLWRSRKDWWESLVRKIRADFLPLPCHKLSSTDCYFFSCFLLHYLVHHQPQLSPQWCLLLPLLCVHRWYAADIKLCN